MKIIPITVRPTVLFLGDIDHVDFRVAAGLLRRDADAATTDRSPELIVVAHSRPGSTGSHSAESLRREAPLAGLAVLAGSWCEGELRTGRPWSGVHRLYWYEFAAWWQRQLKLRRAGSCPDWCRPEESVGTMGAFPQIPSRRPSGTILLNADFSTSEYLADVFHVAGYTPIRAAGMSTRSIRGARAAIWDGGQLSQNEERDLSRLCAAVAIDRIPVVALLDFPRRDRVERAIEIGASAVVGKPWRNSNLLATIEAVGVPASLPIAA
ncbi:MAG TPA: hypothetical protein VH107_05075 [Lacipirellulaceae bacterium]|nr:hypothetical protein [Lacipirellulaceae bacterium]